jgi:hypothetical protein
MLDVLDRLDLGFCITGIQQRRRWTSRIDDDLHYLCHWCIGMSLFTDRADDQNWLVRSASEVEQNIVSVERVLGYADLSSEAAAFVPEKKPAQDWPHSGDITFE